MIRKLSLAGVAAIALGATALAPTSASAWGGHWGGHGWGGHGWGGGWHRGYGYGYGGPRFYGAYSTCGWHWVATPWGPRRRWC